MMFPHGACRRNDALQDLDLVSALIVHLILVAPQADGHQVLWGCVLLQDPPLMPLAYHVPEGVV